MDQLIVTCIAGIIILACCWFKFTSYQYHKKQREWQRKLVDARAVKAPIINVVNEVTLVASDKNILIDAPATPLQTSSLISHVTLDSGKPMPLISISLPSVDVSKIEKYDGLGIKDLKIS